MSPVSSPDGRLHAAMAGNGNPYRVLTPERLPLLWALRADGRPAAVAAALGMGEQHLQAQLDVLSAEGFVVQGAAGYRMSFVSLSAEEVRRADAHARAIGRMLAERLLAGWEQIEAACRVACSGAETQFDAARFLLVAGRLLDIGLLDALAADVRLMPAAPPRPSPSDPRARYYLWMIEGTRADLGQYGQRTSALPWPGWELLTFGRYALPGAAPPGPTREACEATVLAQAHQAASPAALGTALGLPVFDASAAAIWQRFAFEQAVALLPVYHAAEPELRALWATCAAAAGHPHGFPEFFCWYDHIAYAHAIDTLIAAGALRLPTAGYAAALWEGGE